MFLVCGEAVIDLFHQKEQGGLAFSGQVAGSPLNVAIGLARLGCASSFMTGLSTDPFGTRVITALEKEGVAWDLSQRTHRPTILSFVMLKPDGQPDYAFYGENAADFAVKAEALPPHLPVSIDAVHLAGFPLAVETSKTAYAALMRREATTRFISLDPNIRAALMGDMDIFRDHFETLVPLAALIKASVEDIETLYPGVNALTIAKRWRSLGCGTIVITDGSKGAFGLNDCGIVQSKSQAVAVLDTVGAGDSFMSAFLAGLHDHKLLNRDNLSKAPNLKELLDFANMAAGITCTRRGANPPSRADIAASQTS